MNIRDDRSVGEQVKSGVRLAGWVLLTLASIYVLLLCAGLFIGKPEHNQPIYRVVGACGLVAMSMLMYATVRHWVGWFLGALGYLVLKTVFLLLLGSSLVQSRMWFAEFALLLGLAALLCARYISRKPQNIEAAALVGFVVALSFALVLDSVTPLLSGVIVLAVVQISHGRKHRQQHQTQDSC